MKRVEILITFLCFSEQTMCLASGIKTSLHLIASTGFAFSLSHSKRRVGVQFGSNKSEMCLFFYYRGTYDACDCGVLFITLKIALRKSSVSKHMSKHSRLKCDVIDSIVTHVLLLLLLFIVIPQLPVESTSLAPYVLHINACR